jgi:hypothetical protein
MHGGGKDHVSLVIYLIGAVHEVDCLGRQMSYSYEIFFIVPFTEHLVTPYSKSHFPYSSDFLPDPIGAKFSANAPMMPDVYRAEPFGRLID